MAKFTWQDGTLVSKAKVEINGTIYEVDPEEYSGTTPLSASNLNSMQDGIYEDIGNVNNLIVDNNLVGAINKIASYSTTPVKIGEWYDGRDILRRVVHLGAWQQKTGTITIPETPIDILVNTFYTFKLSNGKWYPKFVGISNIVIQDSTTLYFQVTENLSVADSHIILEYVEPQN